MIRPPNSVGAEIIDTLAEFGVREIFGVPGAALSPLLASLVDHSGIRYVGVRHESAAAHMAAAAAQHTGRVGVCFGEQGPGTLNLVAGLGGAFNNRLPVLALTVSGSSVTARPGSGALMELDALVASAAVTTWQGSIVQGGSAAAMVREAVSRARGPRPGPVLLDIARDIVAGPVRQVGDDLAANGALVSTSVDSIVDRATLLRAAELLGRAERPLVIAGGGCTDPKAAHLAGEVASLLGAVLVTTQMGIGALRPDADTYAGHGGVISGPALIRAAREADVVLAIGTRFSSWWWEQGRPLVSGAAVLHIEVAEHSVPAPGDPYLKLHGHASLVLEQLLPLLVERPPNKWAIGVGQQYRAHLVELNTLAADRGADSSAKPMHPAALARELAELLPDDALLVLDGGHTSFWSNDRAHPISPRRVLHEPGMAQLGFGLPAANALCVINPGVPVVCITGDGAFGFSLAELDTARREGLCPLVVIHNNSSWGVVALAQARAGFSLGTDLDGTDCAAVARGFGCFGIRVNDLTELPAAIKAAQASELPAVIDVIVRFEPHPMMPAFGAAMAVPLTAD